MRTVKEFVRRRKRKRQQHASSQSQTQTQGTIETALGAASNDNGGVESVVGNTQESDDLPGQGGSNNSMNNDGKEEEESQVHKTLNAQQNGQQEDTSRSSRADDDSQVNRKGDTPHKSMSESVGTFGSTENEAKCPPKNAAFRLKRRERPWMTSKEDTNRERRSSHRRHSGTGGLMKPPQYGTKSMRRNSKERGGDDGVVTDDRSIRDELLETQAELHRSRLLCLDFKQQLLKSEERREKAEATNDRWKEKYNRLDDRFRRWYRMVKDCLSKESHQSLDGLLVAPTSEQKVYAVPTVTPAIERKGPAQLDTNDQDVVDGQTSDDAVTYPLLQEQNGRKAPPTNLPCKDGEDWREGNDASLKESPSTHLPIPTGQRKSPPATAATAAARTTTTTFKPTLTKSRSMATSRREPFRDVRNTASTRTTQPLPDPVAEKPESKSTSSVPASRAGLGTIQTDNSQASITQLDKPLPASRLVLPVQRNSTVSGDEFRSDHGKKAAATSLSSSSVYCRPVGVDDPTVPKPTSKDEARWSSPSKSMLQTKSMPARPSVEKNSVSDSPVGRKASGHGNTSSGNSSSNNSSPLSKGSPSAEKSPPLLTKSRTMSHVPGWMSNRHARSFVHGRSASVPVRKGTLAASASLPLPTKPPPPPPPGNTPTGQFYHRKAKEIAATKRRQAIEAQAGLSTPPRQPKVPPASSTRTPSPLSFQYEEVIRNKAERQCLPGHACPHCNKFWDVVCQNGIIPRQHMEDCSRHRGKHSPNDTPPGYWDLSFVDEKT